MEYDIGSKIKAARIEKKANARTGCSIVGCKSSDHLKLGKGKWAFTLFFGIMYMLAEYGTFKIANNITFNKLNSPDLGMIVAGAIISAIGMLSGSLWNKKRYNQTNK